MESLIKEKGYKVNTFYLAVRIFDNYLIKIANKDIKAPKLDFLAIASVFLAAKIEEHLSPNAEKLVRAFKHIYCVKLTVKELLELESDILIELQFDLKLTTPLDFLPRF